MPGLRRVVALAVVLLPSPPGVAHEVSFARGQLTVRDVLRAVSVEDRQIAVLAEALGRAPQTLYNRLNTLRRLLADCVIRRLAAS